MTADLLLIWPELILTVGGLIVLMLGTFLGDRATPAYMTAATATLVAAMVAVVLGFDTQATAFSGMLAVDSFAALAKLIIYAATIICLIVGPRFFGGAMRAEYAVLLIFAALGMGIMAAARDMMTLYIGLELNSLASYVLASFMRNDDRSTEAGLKYFVLGALASGMLLYGISLLYGFSGTTDFAGIAAAVGGDMNLGLLFGIVFVIAGLSFKISAVPFHMWTPDVYEGAPTPVTMLFASAPKVAAMALLTRVTLSALGPAVDAWQQIIIFLALASIILGAVGAIGQKNFKRLLAYSSINNVGYMLIGLAAGSAAGVQGIMSYLIVYVVTTIGAFLILLQLRDDKGEPIESIAAYAGLSQRRPGIAAAMAVFLFSLAGIPPLFGFWPKYLVFEAAVNAHLVPLAVVGIVASIMAAFYYIAIIKTMYFDDVSDVELGEPGTLVERGLVAAGAIWLAVVGYLFIPWLANISTAATAGLF